MPDRTPIAHRLPLIATAIVVALGLVPGAASAASVKKQRVCDDEGACTDVVTYVAAKAEPNVVSMTLEGNTITIRDESIPITDGTGCERIDDRAVRCVDQDLSDAKFDLGDGNDTITASPLVTVDGGPGDDRITGGKLTYAQHDFTTVDLAKGTGGGLNEKDVLSGITSVTGSDADDRLYGDGRDNVLDGGNGEDTVVGRDGDDDLSGDDIDFFDGGDGDDVIRSGDKSSDGVECGAGRDVVGSPPAGYADRIDNLTADCERVVVLGLGTLVAQPKLSRGALEFKSVDQGCRCALSVALLDGDTGRRIGSVKVKRTGKTLRVPLNAGGLRLMRGRGDDRSLKMTVKRGRSAVGGYGIALPPR